MNNPIETWCDKEADAVFTKIKGTLPAKGYVTFETGYGPSGLPHIGTFCEVVRTDMVRQAFVDKYAMPTKLICFSDDMDAMRKVPTNVPNQELLSRYIGYSLTAVPDPFEECASFAEHNNALLMKFLDSLGIDYQFVSAAQCYKGGMFNEGLRLIAQNEDCIKAIIIPELREERQKTYSPIMPIDNDLILQDSVRILDGDQVECQGKTFSLLNGGCKLQWRADWALRHFVFDVDYEMYGKDLIESMQIVKKILKALNKKPATGMFCELFLDGDGAKISKSKGNGITLEELTRFFPTDVSRYFMYTKPVTAKRLSFNLMVDYADKYIAELQRNQAPIKYVNPTFYDTQGVNYSLIVRLVHSTKAKDVDMLIDFLMRYFTNLQLNPFLEELINKAYIYTKEIYVPDVMDYIPTDSEYSAISIMLFDLENLDSDADAEAIQSVLYKVGKHHLGDIKGLFQCIYKLALESSSGPRLGTFIAIYGISDFCGLVRCKIQNFE